MTASLFFFIALFAANVAAECQSPWTTPTECTFKREDTHLLGNQPAFSFIKDDRVDELLSQGRTFIDRYYSSVKTTGDIAQRYMIAPTVFAMTVVETEQFVRLAQITANDPFNLKDLGIDILCQIFWDVVTRGARACPTTAEMLTDFNKLAEFDDVRRQIMDIVFNPNLNIGAQWPDSIAEIESIRARLRSVETFGRHIQAPDVEAYFNQKYPSLNDLIAAGPESRAQALTRIRELNNSRRDTIQDHMMATRQSHINMMSNDRAELNRLDEMTSKSVGRMQASEIQNMIDIQNVQNTQMIIEEIMNTTTMYMQDMADSHAITTRHKAYATISAEPILLHEATTGNGQDFMQ